MSRLQGENRTAKLRQTADKLASKISSEQEVAGMVFMDGLSRGFMDKYPDIDIIVFLHKENSVAGKQIRHISLKEQQLFNIDMDVEVHTLNVFRKKKWNEIDRWSFSKAEITFDSNGMIKQLLDEKPSVSNEF